MTGAIDCTICKCVRRELRGTKEFIPLLLHRFNLGIMLLCLADVGSLSIVVVVLGLQVLVWIHC